MKTSEYSELNRLVVDGSNNTFVELFCYFKEHKTPVEEIRKILRYKFNYKPDSVEVNTSRFISGRENPLAIEAVRRYKAGDPTVSMKLIRILCTRKEKRTPKKYPREQEHRWVDLTGDCSEAFWKDKITFLEDFAKLKPGVPMEDIKKAYSRMQEKW